MHKKSRFLLSSVTLPFVFLVMQPAYAANTSRLLDEKISPFSESKPEDDLSSLRLAQVSGGNTVRACTNSFVNTGMLVNAGDKLSISATGRITFGWFAGSGGPLGIFFNPDYNYFFNVPHGYLMARVYQPGLRDLDGWLPIGEGAELIARFDGELEFLVNDNNPQDNSGEFCITVVNSTSPQPASSSSEISDDEILQLLRSDFELCKQFIAEQFPEYGPAVVEGLCRQI